MGRRLYYPLGAVAISRASASLRFGGGSRDKEVETGTYFLTCGHRRGRAGENPSRWVDAVF